LFVDKDSALVRTVNTHTPVFYKTLDAPLAVTVGAQTLTIKWELRF
jgi:hypothetical protein